MASKFFTAFNKPPRGDSDINDFEPSLTDGSYKDDCDINVLLARYQKGDMSVVRGTGVYADVSGLGDFAHNVEQIRKAKDDFLALPAAVRDRFDNDPVKLVEFLQDRNNDEEAIALGLRVAPAVEPPHEVKEVNSGEESKKA